MDFVQNWSVEIGSNHGTAPVFYPDDEHSNSIVVSGEDGRTHRIAPDGHEIFVYDMGVKSSCSPVVGDLDGDGLAEIVNADFEGNIHCLSGEGKLLWQYAAGGRINYTMAIVDVDGDGKKELIATTKSGWVTCLGHGGKLRWKFMAEPQSGPVAVGDINHDGSPEIVFGSDLGKIYCIDARGKYLWHREIDGHFGRSLPLIADPDGDGSMDVLITRSEVCSNAAVLALDGLTGGLLWETGRHWRSVWAVGLALWDALQQKYRNLHKGLQLGLPFFLALAFYVTPGPVSLFWLALLGLVFALRLETGLLILSFSISFFLARKSLPLGTVSILELGLFILAIAAGWRLILRISRGASPPTFSSLRAGATDGAALSLLALATITTFTAPNFGVAMFELRTLVIGSVAFYFLIRLVPWLESAQGETMALRLSDAFLAGATLHAALALGQYVVAPEQTIGAEGVRRALGYLYGSPNNLALFLDRAFPLLLALTLFGSGPRRRLLYALSLLIVGAALFLTFSKGALLLALPATILFIALVRGGKTAWLGAGSGLILLAVALIPISRTERFQSTFSLQPGSTAFFRLKVWQSAWAMLQDFPLTGVGLDNFLYQYRTRYILPEAWQEPNLSHPHNLFLDFGTRLGLGGIFILLWLLWQFWRGAIAAYRRCTQANTQALLLGLMGSMVAFFVHGLIDNAYFLVDLAYTFFLSLGIVEILRSADQKT